MTSREKAIELVTLFIDNVNPYIGSGMLSNHQDDGAIVWQSKMVAVKCVNQIKDGLAVTTGHLELNGIESNEVAKDFEFWKDVAEKINKVETKDIFKD